MCQNRVGTTRDDVISSGGNDTGHIRTPALPWDSGSLPFSSVVGSVSDLEQVDLTSRRVRE